MLSTEEFLITQRLSPPAIVQAAFDEARIVAECRALIVRRDEAKGEFKSVIIALGQKFLEARRAMCGAGHYTPAFIAFIEKCGLAKRTVEGYMSYARKPERLTRDKSRRGIAPARRRTLVEIRDMLTQAADLDAAIEAIDLELADEAK